MGERFHAVKQNRYPFDPSSTATFFSRMIAGGVVFMTEGGFLAGMIGPEPSNARYLVAHEAFWWSEDRSGLRLRKAFEEWAKKNGCSEVQFSHPEGEEVVGRILERAGYEPATRVWRKSCV